MEEIQPGTYQKGNKIFTKNAAPGETVYGEQLVEEDDIEYREWNPHRSKAGAAVKKDIELGIETDSEVLYLGAASGTTVSHFSDILENGFVFGVEYSDTTARQLVDVAEKRENIAPVLADARRTQEYEDLVDRVDVVFQDISQQDQAEIFMKNSKSFLKEDGIGLIAIKARSISSSRNVDEIFSETKGKLMEEFEIVEETRLEPYEKEHLFLKLKKK